MKSVLMLTIAVVAVATATPAPQVHRGTKIIGGVNASIDDFLHYLQLEYNGYFLCGASIYNAYTAITSAYSVSGHRPQYMKLRSGSDQLASGGTLHQAVNITIHPNYTYPGEDYDVALVIVDEPFDATNAISLILSPPPAGALLNITGMGATSSIGRSLSPTLQTKTVKLIDHDECKVDYGDSRITDNMLCAEKSAWSYDEGAPLEYLGQLAGTFSYDVNPKPGIYTNIANLRSWIRDNAVE